MNEMAILAGNRQHSAEAGQPVHSPDGENKGRGDALNRSEHMEHYTEEVYYYDTMESAVEALEQMKIERPCEMAFDVSALPDGSVKMVVKVGEPF